MKQSLQLNLVTKWLIASLVLLFLPAAQTLAQCAGPGPLPTALMQSSNNGSAFIGTLASLTDNNFTSGPGTNIGNGQNIRLDFGSPVTMTGVTLSPLHTSTGFGPQYLNGAALQYSNDGTTWTTLQTIAGTSVSTLTTFSFAAVSARYIRLVTTSNTYLGISEFRVATLGNAGATNIGGTAYRDFNSDGTQGASDPGIANVTVTIFSCDVSGTSTQVSQLQTDNNGAYNFTGLTVGTTYRVEFSNLPSGYRPTYQGGQNGTTAQFVQPGNCAISIGLNVPDDYCQANPRLVTTCFVNGLANSTVPAVDVIPSVNYLASGSDMVAMGEFTESVKSQVGSVWGLAYSRSRKKLYSASFLKRHVGLKGGLGDIYETTVGAPNDGALFITIPNAGTIGTDAVRGLGTPTGQSLDTDAFGKVGRVGLGGIDVSEDEKTLFVINLADKKLYSIDIDTKAILGSVSVPGPCDATKGQTVPFALKSWRGKVYVGTVCDASLSGSRADLAASVFVYDPATGTFSASPVLTFPLNYQRNPAWNSPSLNGAGGENMAVNSAKWHPWVDVFNTVQLNAYVENGNPPRYVISHPTPVLSDIDFDNNGNMLLGLFDRIGHQFGIVNRAPDNSRNEDAIIGGDILKANFVSTTNWTIETLSTSTAQEFFTGENFVADHQETSQGGLAYLPGANAVALTAMDPINYNTGGFIYLSNSNGAQIQAGVQLYTNLNGGFGKSSGLGDLTMMCDLPPIQIGNRVWRDDNRNGIQDPCEPPIAGAVVKLYNATKTTELASVTTNAAGEFYFSTTLTAGSSTSSAATAALTANSSYALVITNLGTSTVVTSQGLTLTDVSPLTPGESGASNSGSTIANNDAQVDAGRPCIKLTTGGVGENNHTYDFGLVKFVCVPPSATASSSSPTVCTGQSVALTVQVLPTGSYTYAWTAPSGVTLTGANTATATAANFTTTGLQTFTVTVSSSPTCFTTATVSVSAISCTQPVDIGVTKVRTSAQQSTVGGAVSFQVVARNNSAITATSVVITDLLGAADFGGVTAAPSQGGYTAGTGIWNVGTLSAGASATLTINATVLREGISYNTASLSSVDGGDTNPNNNVDRACVTVPVALTGNQTYTAIVPAQYTGVEWFKDGNSIATGNTYIVTTSGVYTFTAANGGCAAGTCCPLIVQKEACNLTATAQASSQSICLGQSVMLNAQVSPAGGYTYVWNAPAGITLTGAGTATATTSGITTTGIKTFTVTVSSSPTCFTTATVSVLVNPPTTLPVFPPTTLCEGGSVNFSVTPPVGASAYWTTPANTTISSGTVTIASVVPADGGIYTLYYTNELGCVSITTKTLTVNPKPTLSLVNSGCVSGNQSYTVLVSTNATSLTTNVSQFGVTISGNLITVPITVTSFAVSATSALGCLASLPITAPACTTTCTPPNAGPDQSFCEGITSTTLATPAAGEQWSVLQQVSGTTPAITNTGTAYSVSGLTLPGVYKFRLASTSINNCSAVVTITVNPKTVLPAFSPAVICEGQTLAFGTTVAPGASAYWTTPANTTISSGTVTITNATAANSGTYTLIYTNTTGCLSTATQSVTVNANPTLSVANIGCVASGLSYTVLVSTNAASLTTNASAFGVTISGNLITVPSGVTSFAVSASSIAGCVATLPIVGPICTPVCTLPAVGPDQVFCEGPTTTTLVSQGAGAQWSVFQQVNGTTPTINQSGSPVIVSGLTLPGVYKFRLASTSVNNCSAVVTVTVNPKTTITPFTPSTLCEGQGVSFSVNPPTGASAYWTTPANTTISSGTATITNATLADAGVYTLYYTNTSGCQSAPVSKTVIVNAKPTLSLVNSGCVSGNQSYTVLLSTNATSLTTNAAQLGVTLNGNLITAPSGVTSFAVSATSIAGCVASLPITAPVCPTLPASLGDFVWYDTNGNGQQDPGETGVPGVKVNLFDPTSSTITPIASLTTNSQGKYLFNGLTPGVYCVSFEKTTLPTGFTLTTANSGTDATDSDANPVTGKTPNYTLAAGQQELTVDAGIVPPASYGSLGDYVWVDVNNDGLQDNTDVPASGVIVDLYTVTGGIRSTNPIATTVTSASGLYGFTELPSGQYQVKFTIPASATNVLTISPLAFQGNDRTKDANATPLTKTMGFSDVVTIDVTQPVSSTARNNPTIDAALRPRPGVAIVDPCKCYRVEYAPNERRQLYEVIRITASPNENWRVVSQTGMYLADSLTYTPIQVPALLTNVPAGSNTYSLTFTFGDGIGYSMTATNGYDTLTTANTCQRYPVVTSTIISQTLCRNAAPISLTASTDQPTTTRFFYVDKTTNQRVYITEFDPSKFGENETIYVKLDIVPSDPTLCESIVVQQVAIKSAACQASLGNYVWFDTNRNGVQDQTETGVASVTVTLCDAVSGTVISTALTNGAGAYLFSGLDPGSYTVKFTAPTGTTFTIPNSSSATPGTDSNVGSLTGQTGSTAPVSLTAGETNLTVDAGLIPACVLPTNLTATISCVSAINGSGQLVATATSATGSVEYRINGGTYQPAGVFSSLINGLYVVEARILGTTTPGCSATTTATVSCNCVPPTLTVQSPPTTVCAPATFNLTSTSIIVANTGVRTLYYTNLTDANAGGSAGQLANPQAVTASGTYYIRSETSDIGCFTVKPVSVTIVNCTGGLGNFVWKDRNNNGLQDAGEPGVANITVDLYTVTAAIRSSTPIATTVTSASGLYAFTGLPSGSYQVKFTLPASQTGVCQISSNPNAGNDDTNDSDVDPATGFAPVVTIDATQPESSTARNNPTIDMGLRIRPVATIIDPCRCFGVDYYLVEKRELFETIEVTSSTGESWSVVAQTGMLALDTLTKRPVIAGVLLTETPVGSGKYDLSFTHEDAVGYSVTVTNGETVLEIANVCSKYPAYTTTVLSETICRTSAPIALTALAAVPSTAVFYYIDKITKQRVVITEFDPSRFAEGETVTVKLEITNTDPAKCPFTIIQDVLISTVGCNQPLGSIGDLVWKDVNRNGQYDAASETGVASVTVSLLAVTSPVGAPVVSTSVVLTTTTDANGKYLFSGLPAGRYIVVFEKTTLPPNCVLSPDYKKAGVAESLDSDADPQTGRSPIVELVPTDPAQRDILTVDAALIVPDCPLPAKCVPIVIQRIR